MAISLGIGQFKVTLFFHADAVPGGGGFSETYWYAGSTYAAIKTSLLTFVPARMAMLPTTYHFDAARISHEGNAGQDILLDYEGVGLGNDAGTYHPTSTLSPGGSAPIDVALLMRVASVDQWHTSKWLHGVPEEVVDGDVYEPDGAFNTAMTTWTSQLVANTLVKEPKTETFQPAHEVDSITVSNRKTGRPFKSRRGRRT